MNQPELLEATRRHYDTITHLYHLLWGEHIHHGYWDAEESTGEAQLNLIRRLAELAGIEPGSHVLDIGCGLGGSSRWLARELGCTVLGITISPVQVETARHLTREAGLENQISIEIQDANELAFSEERFDVLWIIECSEHLTDKVAFFRTCARLLRPGGRLAVCAWLAAEPEGRTARHDQLIAEVCHGMLCPSLGSLREHIRWFKEAGFEKVQAEDVTSQVARTWELCLPLLRLPPALALLRLADEQTAAFARSFTSIRSAYATGAMAYGMFAARRSGDERSKEPMGGVMFPARSGHNYTTGRDGGG